MLKILLSGCNGRMGQAVTRVVAERDNMRIVAGVDVSSAVQPSFPVYSACFEHTGDVDAVVDFSNPAALPKLLMYCCELKIPIVLSTTGYDDTAKAMIVNASKAVPVFQSANMSLGASLLMDLAARAAAVLGGQFDVEIVERHHNDKLDAPSGTAITLYNRIADALPYQPHPQYDRTQKRAKRAYNEIGIHAVRGGTIVGDHDVIFAGHDEVLTISHNAHSREVFAVGAVKAAEFIVGKRPGLYGMRELIGS